MPRPVEITVTQLPVLRGVLGDDIRLIPVTPPAERAARKAVRLASLSAYTPVSPVDKHTVVSDGAPPLRLATFSETANQTVLVKRPPSEGKASIQASTIIVAPGDTLYDTLDRRGIDTSEAVNLVQALAPVFPPDDLRTGQEISLVVRELGDGRVIPQSLKLGGGNRNASIERDAGGNYLVRGGNASEGETLSHRALASIHGSLYATARAQDVPDAIIVRMMNTHSYDVDFQREIKAGDTFEAFYSAAESDPDTRATPATLMFSSLTTKGKTRGYYRFEGQGGNIDYYDADGASSKKPLMKTPIDGARISSGFGMRKHPILGYTKMHAGADFAAPAGTPVLAAGDGVVEFADRYGGYGNYVRLTHKPGLKTAYAHMSRFAKGIARDKPVRQGQIIGYVGSSGRSTGPHLHYEVHVGGKKQNPLTVKVAGGGGRLKGKELAQFQAERRRIDQMRAEAPVTTRVAAAKP